MTMLQKMLAIGWKQLGWARQREGLSPAAAEARERIDVGNGLAELAQAEVGLRDLMAMTLALNLAVRFRAAQATAGATDLGDAAGCLEDAVSYLNLALSAAEEEARPERVWA